MFGPAAFKQIWFLLYSRVFSVIVFAAMSIGQSSSFAPDFAKAKAATGRILDLLAKTPEIDIYNEAGEKPVSHASWLSDVSWP